ncbi:MAG: OmpA family protein [Betaproteobacteria bacterium]|jgi:outer membrane protein OmpA-like peptidoglycan-associated protein
MKRFVASITLAVLVLGACKTFDPYTGEEKYNSTTKGAVIGAAAGAVVGAISGEDARERRKRALIGAGIGVLAGGAVGAYMDRQEDELRRQMQGTGVSVTRQGDHITLNMPGNITFSTASADMNASFFKVLDGVALVLKKYDKTIVEVDGHTDSVGKPDYNQKLSERRASAVAQYLISKGIKQERTITVGAGEMHPVASNDTEAGRTLNRRVELTLLPLKQ